MVLSQETKNELTNLHALVGNAQDTLHRIVTEMHNQGDDPLELAVLNLKLYEFWEEMDSFLEGVEIS